MNEDMLKELLANKAAMDAMPQATRDALQAQYDALVKSREDRERERSEWMRREEESERKEAEERRKRREEGRREMLGLNIGEWTQKIPRNRRFVLAYRLGKKFVGWYGQEDDPSKWEDEKQYVPMDILRGYTAPYFGYYQYIGLNGDLNRSAKKILLDVVNAKDESTFVSVINREFNFFHYDAKEDKHYGGVAVCEYTVGENGDLNIIGHGEIKTLEQHVADLKAEFGA